MRVLPIAPETVFKIPSSPKRLPTIIITLLLETARARFCTKDLLSGALSVRSRIRQQPQRLNSISKSDDNNYIYNISRKSFANDEDFESWSGEAYERSLINPGVDVNKDDNIITLVTCVYDFDDARLVVMARETREDEDASVDTSAAKANPSPRYPKRWYDDRGIKYPFE